MDNQSRPARRRMLTDAEIEQLPEGIREHYRQHDWLRHSDDLAYFPEQKRAVFLQLMERGRERTLTRIAEQERRQAS
jgi:hypothetical protein